MLYSPPPPPVGYVLTSRFEGVDSISPGATGNRQSYPIRNRPRKHPQNQIRPLRTLEAYARTRKSHRAPYISSRQLGALILDARAY